MFQVEKVPLAAASEVEMMLSTPADQKLSPKPMEKQRLQHPTWFLLVPKNKAE